MHEIKQMRNIACLALAKTSNPVTFLDIGAAAGPNHTALDYLLRKNAISFLGLEPDEKALEELKARYPNATFLPYAVADEPGDRTLHVTLVGGCSSLLEPNFELLEDWPIRSWLRVLHRKPVRVVTVRELIDQGVLPIPDFVKVDIQGLEYEALAGFGDYLDKVTGIEIEATLKPIYKGQKLLWEIHNMLDSKGFILRDLQHQGPFEHELVEVNAFFSKKPNNPTVNLYKLKLWEFFSEINSPESLGQMQLRSPNKASEIFVHVDPVHWTRLLGDIV
jgi:FkbM family methyltransferase